MEKSLILLLLLLVCSSGYADSLQRFINVHKEKDGARCMVYNRDSHFNDVPKGSLSPYSHKLRSSTLKVLGIEEMIILSLDSCKERVRENFSEKVSRVVPDDYALLTDKEDYQIYMSNSDEEYAYILIVNRRAPGLTLLYVTNAFVRAMVSDDGAEFDPDKLGEHLERRAEGIGETVRRAGEKLINRINRMQSDYDDADQKVWF